MTRCFLKVNKSWIDYRSLTKTGLLIIDHWPKMAYRPTLISCAILNWSVILYDNKDFNFQPWWTGIHSSKPTLASVSKSNKEKLLSVPVRRHNLSNYYYCKICCFCSLSVKLMQSRLWKMSHDMQKDCLLHMQTAKAQIRLHVCAVWYNLCYFANLWNPHLSNPQPDKKKILAGFTDLFVSLH